MSFTALVSAIIGLAKAIPVVADLIEQLVNAWVTKDIADMKSANMSKAQQRTALMLILRGLNKEDNAKRAAISIALSNIHNS